jgi:myo-inositol catabolism protein IolC
MAKDKDQDLRHVMAAEGSRGRRQPLKVVSLEERRQRQRIVQMIANPDCDVDVYIRALRDDLRLDEQSERFREYVELWRRYRGVQ